ncbi:MAG: HAMP domain-containing protein [Leptothrix sp. (in: b-proteobacteria)]
MHFAARNISLSKRLWLGFGSVLLFGAATVALLWNSPSESNQEVIAWRHWLAEGLALAAVLSAVLTARSIHHSVQRPLAEAMAAVQALSAGDLEHRIKVERLDEMGQLLVAIDAMSNWLAVMLNHDEPPDGQPTGPDCPFNELHYVERRVAPPAALPAQHVHSTDHSISSTP